MSTFGSVFNLLFFLPILLYILGIASVVMITIALIQSARAQRSIAQSLERIEELLNERK